MKDDEPALLVCNRNMAEFLKSKKPDVEDALVITEYVEDGAVFMVSRDAFLKWLFETEEKDERRRSS